MHGTQQLLYLAYDMYGNGATCDTKHTFPLCSTLTATVARPHMPLYTVQNPPLPITSSDTRTDRATGSGSVQGAIDCPATLMCTDSAGVVACAAFNDLVFVSSVHLSIFLAQQRSRARRSDCTMARIASSSSSVSSDAQVAGCVVPS